MALALTSGYLYHAQMSQQRQINNLLWEVQNGTLQTAKAAAAALKQ